MRFQRVLRLVFAGMEERAFSFQGLSHQRDGRHPAQARRHVGLAVVIISPRDDRGSLRPRGLRQEDEQDSRQQCGKCGSVVEHR